MKNAWLTNEHYLAAIFIILGGGFLLQTVTPLDFGYILGKIWPLFVIAYGFLLLAQQPSQRTAPLAIIAVGTLLMINSLNAWGINIWGLFWPLVLIGIGLMILRRSNTPPTASEDHYNVTTTMSDDKRSVTSQNFHGGQVSVWMGSNKLDLTKAKLADDATINIQVVMGELKIEVPADTKIVNQVSPILAEYKDRTRATDKSKQTLTITGSILMGSVEVLD